MDFATTIKQARDRAGLSQLKAAAAWGVNLKNLQNWEQGVSAPSGPQLMKLLPFLTPPEPAPKPKRSARKR